MLPSFLGDCTSASKCCLETEAAWNQPRVVQMTPRVQAKETGGRIQDKKKNVTLNDFTYEVNMLIFSGARFGKH